MNYFKFKYLLLNSTLMGRTKIRWNDIPIIDYNSLHLISPREEFPLQVHTNGCCNIGSQDLTLLIF